MKDGININQENTESTVKPSFWKRRLINPLISQIKQGASPIKLAQSVSVGAMIGIFPILGTTTTLCGITAVALRLNHIAVQTVNWLIYPLQLLLIIPFLRMGNVIFGFEQFSLSLGEITALFEADFWGSAKNLGWLALRGVLAWVIVAVPMILIMTKIFTPVMEKLSAKVGRGTVTT
jgi:uncharacterized protein (DUF2062 family)